MGSYWRLPQSNAVLDLAERALYDDVFVASCTVSPSCTWAQFTKSVLLNVPKFLIPLFFCQCYSFFFQCHPLSICLAYACSQITVPESLPPSPSLGQVPLSLPLAFLCKGISHIYYSCEGNCPHYSWTLSPLGERSVLIYFWISSAR